MVAVKKKAAVRKARKRSKRGGGDVATRAAAVLGVVAAVGAGVTATYWYLSGAGTEREASRSVPVPQVRAEDRMDEARQLLFGAISQRQLPNADEWTRARDLYQEAAASQPALGAASLGGQLAAGGLDLVEGRYDEALGKLDGVLGGDEEVLAGYALGHLKLRMGQAQDAWGEFGLVLKSRPDWLPAQIGQTLADVELDDLKLASCSILAEAVGSVELTPVVAGAHAHCLEREGDASAAQWYAKAFSLGSRDRRVLEGHIGGLITAGDFEAVARDIEAAVVGSEEPVLARIGLAEVLRDSSQSGMALEHCELALAANPNSIEAAVCVAATSVEATEPSVAVARIDELLVVTPDVADLQLYRAYALAGSGAQEEAYATFRSICMRSRYAPACREACVAELSSRDYGIREAGISCTSLAKGERDQLRAEAEEARATSLQMSRDDQDRRYATSRRQSEVESRARRQKWEREAQQRHPQKGKVYGTGRR